MAEQRRRLVRLAVLEELRASYGIKVKSGGCLAAAKQPGAAAAEVRGRAVTLRPSGRAPPLLSSPGRAGPRRGGAGPLSPARPGGHPVRHR